jgi:hypothetical protein
MLTCAAATCGCCCCCCCFVPQTRADEFGLEDDPEAEAEAAERGEGSGEGAGKFVWSNSDREYTYDELLGEARRC